MAAGTASAPEHWLCRRGPAWQRPARAGMMAFNLVRHGALGVVWHAEGGDRPDQREIKFEKHDEGLWRRAWSMKLDGNSDRPFVEGES